jgi:RNA polymerase sigma-70 factor (ECF subfamily)
MLAAAVACADSSWAGDTVVYPNVTVQATRGVDEFEQIALPHLNDLFRTATHVMGDRSRAEDAVQETYLQALRSFERFTPGTNIRAWLFAILFNVVRHQRRKLFRFRFFGDSDDGAEQNIPAPESLPEKLTDRGILAALDRLPEPFREVVLLVDVEEFSYKEAAEIARVPVGTIMSRLSRARSALRRELTEAASAWGIGKAAQQGGSQ